MKNIIILTGLTCAGKDTCQDYLVKKYNYHPIVSTTSRPMREGEIEGVNYHYISKEDFKKLIADDKLIEYREYHTLVDNKPDVWYYGVEKSEIEKSDFDNLVVVLDSTGYYAFKELYSTDVNMIWVDTYRFIRKHRNKIRGDYNKPEFRRRNKVDTERLANLPLEADHIIKNNKSINKLHKSIDKFMNRKGERK